METETKTSKIDHLIFTTEYQLANINKQIASDADYLIRKLQQAVKDVTANGHLNSCGVLQQSGTDFDKMIAQRQVIIDNLKSLNWAKEAK